jgi:hypothetical protein
MPGRSAASRSFLQEELGANGSFIGRQHGGVLAEDFERTRVILRGHDEVLLAHVGPDFFSVGSIGDVDARFVAYHSRTGRDTALKFVRAIAAEFNMTCALVTNFRVRISHAKGPGVQLNSRE